MIVVALRFGKAIAISVVDEDVAARYKSIVKVWIRYIDLGELVDGNVVLFQSFKNQK